MGNFELSSIVEYVSWIFSSDLQISSILCVCEEMTLSYWKLIFTYIVLCNLLPVAFEQQLKRKGRLVLILMCVDKKHNWIRRISHNTECLRRKPIQCLHRKIIIVESIKWVLIIIYHLVFPSLCSLSLSLSSTHQFHSMNWENKTKKSSHILLCV